MEKLGNKNRLRYRKQMASKDIIKREDHRRERIFANYIPDKR